MTEISNYTPLAIQKFPKKAIDQNPENKFWKKYEKIYEKQYDNSIKQVSSGNNKKGLMAFVYKDILEVYDSKEEQIKFTVNKLFKSNLYSVCIREDSELMGVGEESGRVQVVEVKKKQPLRKYNGHNKPVHSVQFMGKHLLVSGSDDQTVQVVDVAMDKVVQVFTGVQKDYIRAVQVVGHNSILSGSYDGTVVVLDSRTGEAASTFNHHHPVQAIAPFTNGFSFVSVGGTHTKLWDIRNTTQPIQNKQTNQKDISDVKVVLDNQRVVVSSYDNHLKVLTAADLQVTHQFKYSHPLMSFDFLHDCTRFAVGLADGQFLMYNKNTNLPKDQQEQEEDIFKGFFKHKEEVVKNQKYFQRGMFHQPKDYTFIQGEERRRKTKVYDQMLKKFEFKNALIHCLHSQQHHLVYSLVQELIQRNVLRAALKSLDQQQFTLLITFIQQTLSNQRYNHIAITLADLLFELYWNQMDIFETQFQDLKVALDNEVQDQEQLLELNGIIDNIVTNSYLQ